MTRYFDAGLSVVDAPVNYPAVVGANSFHSGVVASCLVADDCVCMLAQALCRTCASSQSRSEQSVIPKVASCIAAPLCRGAPAWRWVRGQPCWARFGRQPEQRAEVRGEGLPEIRPESRVANRPDGP